MRGLTLLIVDGDEDFRQALDELLRPSYTIYHSPNGKHALETVRKLNPDFIVMELMLTELDGISLLHAVRELGMHPVVLAVTRMFTSYIFENAEALGIEYVIRKPCYPASVAQRLNDLSLRIKTTDTRLADPDAYITEQLGLLGFSPKHNGSDYLRQAVLLMYRKSSMSITKELYPSVAAICGTSSTLVERSIRTAVTAAWEQSGRKWAELYPTLFRELHGRPSNGVIISLLAEHLRTRQTRQDPQ